MLNERTVAQCLGVLVLLAALAVRPIALDAAPPEKLHRIGMLERTPASTSAANLDAFRQGLRELGYVEGETFAIEYRSADGHDDRFPALASDLVRLKVDLIVTRGTPAALAAKNATRAQVRAMEEALDAMEADRDKGMMPLGADRLFHLRIAEASGNSALALVVKTLWDQRTGPLFLRLEHHFDTPALWTVAIREHREIVSAIARHDATAARAAMRRHMDMTKRRYSKDWKDAGE